jgi:CheY-like chemotaxis protein
MARRDTEQAGQDGGGATYVPPFDLGGSGLSAQAAHQVDLSAGPARVGGNGSSAGAARRSTRHGNSQHWDLERLSDRIALTVGSTASFYVHLAFYGGLFALHLVGVPLATILLLVATVVSLEAVFLIIFVQRSANQQAARLEEAIAVIRHNTADHLTEPLDVVVKDIRRELAETTARVAELARALREPGPAAPAGNVAPAGGTESQVAAACSAVDVLVVDDDVAVCELVRDVLADHGYSVLMATSGERAVAMLGACQPRLVLADLDMPAMSGWALSAWLRAHDRLQGVPIILISASVQLAREARLLGAQGYVAKPFDIDYLLRVVGSHLLAA